MKHGNLSALVFATIAILCSCGKSDDGVLRLGYLQSDLHHLPAFIALEKGFFRDEGLAVRVGGVFKAGPEEMSAFGAGELDFGYVGQAPATAAVFNGVADVQFIAQVNREGSAVVCRSGGGPESIRGLKGMAVAIPGHATMQDFLLRRALAAEGLTYQDIRPIVLKPPEMLQALEQKNIDAFIAWQPYPALAAGRAWARVLLDSSAIWPGHPCCVLVASRSLCAARPETVRKIQSAHTKACAFIHENPDEALSIAVKYTSLDRSALAAALGHIRFYSRMEKEQGREFADFLKIQNYIKPGVSEDKIFSGLFF